MAKPTKFRGKWRIRWMDESGKRCSSVFDTHKEADFQLKLRESEVEAIRRGLKRRAPDPRLFGELCDRWLVERASEKRSERDDRSMIRRHLRPFFGDRQLRAIDGGAIRHAYVQSKLAPVRGRALAKKTVNNHLTLLVAMLNYAENTLGWLEAVPKIKKLEIPNEREDFRFLRSTEEINQLLEASLSVGEHVHAMYATGVYTGLRAGELAGLRWLNVDLEKRRIDVCCSYEGPTKSMKIRFVPIVNTLLPTLTKWKRRAGARDLVFPNRDGNMHQKSARIFQEVLHRVLERAKFESVRRDGEERRYITFHGLRHTFASHWVMRGGSIYRLQKVLGHASIETTQRYAHLIPDAFVEDYDRFDASPKKSDVEAASNATIIPFPPRPVGSYNSG